MVSSHKKRFFFPHLSVVNRSANGFLNSLLTESDETNMLGSGRLPDFRPKLDQTEVTVRTGAHGQKAGYDGGVGRLGAGS